MAEPRLTKVSIGVNKKTWKPIFYVEARMSPSMPWRLITDGKKWLTHRSEAAANREAKKLHNKLSAKLRDVSTTPPLNTRSAGE